MKTPRFYRAVVAALLLLPLATPLQSRSPDPQRPKNNTRYRFNRVTLKHRRTGTVPWLSTPVPSDAEELQFTLDVRGTALPPEVSMKVQLRRVCPAPGSGLCRTRFVEFFTSKQRTSNTVGDTNIPLVRNAAQTQGTAVFEMVVHPCADCPTSFNCPFPDPDHLGQGPYEAMITVADPGSPLSDAADTQQVVYMHNFTTTARLILRRPGAKRPRTGGAGRRSQKY